MMDQQGVLRDHGEAGRWRTSLLGLAVLVVALIGALLVSVTTAGSQGVTALSGGSKDVGTLELFANDADGDGFRFVDDGGTTGSSPTEYFTTNNRSKLTETDEDENLVTLTPNTGATNQTYVGLKDHVYGVRVQGEGGGTPAAQINGSQTLTVDLLVGEGADLPGDGASYAELALKFKFGATVSILPLDATGEPVLEDPMEVTFTCDGGGASDCGSDSGADRDVVRVPEEGTDPSRPFTSVVISILDPSDGAVSLIDDPGFETFFNIVEEFDGEIACDFGDGTNAKSNDLDGVGYTFTRIGQLDDDCGVIKPFNEAIFLGTQEEPAQIQFEPDSVVQSVYRGDLTFPAGTNSEFFNTVLEYDPDGPGTTAGFDPMDECIRTVLPPVPSPEQQALADAFEEFGGDAYPDPAIGQVACVASYSTVVGGLETWVLRVDYDPWFRR